MSSNKSNSSQPPRVPAAMLAQRIADWHLFTGAIVKGSIGVAVLLVLMFVFLWWV